MSIEPADWVIPGITLAAASIWLVNLRAALPRITRRHPVPDVRIVTIATLAAVAVSLTWSSLLYPDIISVEASRWGITAARLSLLIGGIAVWVMSHREEVAP